MAIQYTVPVFELTTFGNESPSITTRPGFISVSLIKLTVRK